MSNLPSDDSRKQDESILRPPDSYPDNDYGNAQRLVESDGDRLRYCHAFKKWLIWDGQRWFTDQTEYVRQIASATIQQFGRDVFGDKDRRNFAISSLNHSSISHMLDSAQTYLSITPASLDTDPDLLNFTNGTLDLKTGKLSPHFPKFYITRLIHHDYNPSATHPLFTTFLDAITEPHKNLSRYLQRALGYSLTGHTREKCVFLPWGRTDNGKTTLLSIVFDLIPDYATLIQINTLMTKQETSNTQSDLSDLRGVRFAMTSEANKGQRLSEGNLKRITQGLGGKIKTMRKYENSVTFFETHKLWIDSNHLPVVSDTNDAIWNRLKPIPFSVTIPKSKQDKTLHDTLIHQEAEGILAWLVQGSVLWYKHGLPHLPAIKTAAKKWRRDSDQLTRFFDQCLIFDPVGEMAMDDIYELYKDWAIKDDEAYIYKLREVRDRLETEPGVVYKHSEKRRVYQGVKERKFGRRAGLAVEDQEDEPVETDEYENE